MSALRNTVIDGILGIHGNRDASAFGVRAATLPAAAVVTLRRRRGAHLGGAGRLAFAGRRLSFHRNRGNAAGVAIIAQTGLKGLGQLKGLGEFCA